MTRKELIDEFKYVEWVVVDKNDYYSIESAEQLTENDPPVIEKIEFKEIAKHIAENHNRTLYKPTNKIVEDGIQVGDFTFSVSKRMLYNDCKQIKIPNNEARLLALLISAKGKKVLQKDLLMQIWGSLDKKSRDLLKSLIYNIKQYFIDDDSFELFYVNKGYVLNFD